MLQGFLDFGRQHFLDRVQLPVELRRVAASGRLPGSRGFGPQLRLSSAHDRLIQFRVRAVQNQRPQGLSVFDVQLERAKPEI